MIGERHGRWRDWDNITAWWLKVDNFATCRAHTGDHDRGINIHTSAVETVEEGEEGEFLNNHI
jgi:hypothetical protein